MTGEKSVTRYISEARALREMGNLKRALNLLNEATMFYFDERELFFERAKVHLALGNWPQADKDGVEAMNILYRTKSQITDDQRIEKIDLFDRYDKHHEQREPPR